MINIVTNPKGGQRINGITPKQLRIARWAVAGMCTKEIAMRLNCSGSNVKYHLSRIYERLQLFGRGYKRALLVRWYMLEERAKRRK